MSNKLGRREFITSLILVACAEPPDDRTTTPPEPAPPLTLGCWNLEWFGSLAEGPPDERLQLESVREVIRESDADVWALSEIADASQFQALVSELPEYEGFLAGSVAPGDQELGLLYKTSAVGLRSAERILGSHERELGGRPPLLARLDVGTEEVVVIVLHAKAFDDAESWQRRQDGAVALKELLDSSYPTQALAVLGDFNDDVDASISAGLPSPYAAFAADRLRYAIPTAELSAVGRSSTLRGDAMIDHHLVSNELGARYIDGSAELLDVEDYVAAQASAASDHHPVISRYERGARSSR